MKLEKGTKGKVGFRTGMQGGKQVMKTDGKVTVMNKGTKASGGTKARKSHSHLKVKQSVHL